jgi:hypothetical protein
MAVIAGRHHDACEGIELNVLRIVHVACRLADALGYDVVKPLVPLSADEILAELPVRGRQRLMQAPEDLLKRIEERIRDFTGETGEIQPEEALALLASATTTHEPAVIAAAEPHPPSARPLISEAPVEIEQAVSGSQVNWKQALIVGIVMGVAATGVLAYWLFR